MSLRVPLPSRRLVRPGAVIAVLIAITVAIVATPRAEAATPTAPKAFFGVSGRHLDNQDYSDLQTAGVGTYRTLFNFRIAKHHPKGYYDWGSFDALVGRMASRDIRLLPLLYGTPPWIYRDTTVPPIFGPAARREWTRLLTELVKRYGPQGEFWRMNPLIPYHPITAWQIWNEPNSAAFWPTGPSPGEYGRLLKLSADAIHRIDPNATIVTAGIIADPVARGSIPGAEYLAALAASRAIRGVVDKYAYHPYAKNARAVLGELQQARNALRAHGQGGAPIWVTEVGWGSDFLLDQLLLKTRQGQARALRLTYAAVLARRKRLGIERMLWYYWRDQSDPLCLWCRSAGLLDRSHERKPAFVAFRRLGRS